MARSLRWERVVSAVDVAANLRIKSPSKQVTFRAASSALNESSWLARPKSARQRCDPVLGSNEK